MKYFRSPLIPLNNINELLNVCTLALKLQESLKKKTMNDFEDVQEDCDDDQKEDFQGEYESYNDLMQVVMEITGTLIKLYKQNIENVIFTNIVPYYYKAFNNTAASENELLYTICIFDDVLENCSETLYHNAIADIYMNFLNIFNNTKNNDIIQSLVYGFGVFAIRTNANVFSQYYMNTCQVIYYIYIYHIYHIYRQYYQS